MPGTPFYTREVLEGIVGRSVERAGYRLDRLFVGEEGASDRQVVHDLISHLRASDCRTVLVAGRANVAVRWIEQVIGVQVMTLPM